MNKDAIDSLQNAMTLMTIRMMESSGEADDGDFEDLKLDLFSEMDPHILLSAVCSINSMSIALLAREHFSSPIEFSERLRKKIENELEGYDEPMRVAADLSLLRVRSIFESTPSSEYVTALTEITEKHREVIEALVVMTCANLNVLAALKDVDPKQVISFFGVQFASAESRM